MRLPVVFMRGGTSKGLFFHERDLPKFGPARDAALLSAMGSPDPYGRQLNGMGGGISSLSKTIVVRRSDRDDADIEFLHGQVAVDSALVDYSANCGNLSAAVGPFAIDEGLFEASGDGTVTVRIFNQNSGALIHAEVPIAGGRFNPHGRFVMPGISGSASQIALQYLRPGAGGTTTLFPTGRLSESIPTSAGPITTTLAFATLPVAWVLAEDVGLDPTIMPDPFDADRRAMGLLEEIRREAAVRMGLAKSQSEADQASPKIGVIGAPKDYRSLDGEAVAAADFDMLVRVVSMGRAHKASPLTGAMCLAATCLAKGTVPSAVCRPLNGRDVRLGTPSGVLTVGAELGQAASPPTVDRTMVFSTARRLMDGWVNADA